MKYVLFGIFSLTMSVAFFNLNNRLDRIAVALEQNNKVCR